jgi:RNA polymerase sigma factor (sigma-70 family)
MGDLEFVQRCVKPDKLAWDEFLNKYSRLIYSYIYKVINIKGYSLTQVHIEDLFQEIIFSLVKDNFRKLKSFKALNGCTLASWLRQVTINFTIDSLRKLKTPALSLDQEDADGFSLKGIIADPTKTASAAAVEKENLASLADCIQKLDLDDKYFMELHLNIGITLEELKDIFKLSRGAVDMRKARIIQRLKECFKGKGFILPE